MPHCRKDSRRKLTQYRRLIYERGEKKCWNFEKMDNSRSRVPNSGIMNKTWIEGKQQQASKEMEVIVC